MDNTYENAASRTSFPATASRPRRILLAPRFKQSAHSSDCHPHGVEKDLQASKQGAAAPQNRRSSPLFFT